MIEPANNTEQALLTVCIITHERPRLFARAYDSTLRAIQEVPAPVELIVYNSSRESVALVPGSKGREVHVPELGPAVFKRHLATQACPTPWLVFLDDDCEMAPGALAHVYHLIRHARKNGIGAYFPVTRFDGPQGFWFRILDQTGYLTDFYQSRHARDLPWGPTSFAVFEVNALRSSGGFDTSINVPAGGEDVDVCLKLRRNGFRLAAIPEELAVGTTQTWNTFTSNLKRSVNYGRAEFELQRCWPDYRAIDLASTALISGIWLLAWLLLAARGAGPALVVGFPVAWLFALCLGESGYQYIEYRKPFVATFALGVLQLGYRFGYIRQALGRRSLAGLFRRFDWYRAISFERASHPLFGAAVWIRWGASALVMAFILGVLP